MREGFDVARLWQIHSAVVGADKVGLSAYESTTDVLMTVLAEMDEHIGPVEMHESTIDKGVVLARGIAVALPFATGNWGTALAAMVVWLRLHGVRLTDNGLEEASVLIYELGTGNTTVSEAALWVSRRIVLL